MRPQRHSLPLRRGGLLGLLGIDARERQHVGDQRRAEVTKACVKHVGQEAHSAPVMGLDKFGHGAEREVVDLAQHLREAAGATLKLQCETEGRAKLDSLARDHNRDFLREPHDQEAEASTSMIAPEMASENVVWTMLSASLNAFFFDATMALK